MFPIIIQFNSFHCRLPLETNREVEEWEVSSLDLCPRFSRVERCVSAALDFCDTFVSEALFCTVRTPSAVQFRAQRCRHLAAFFRKLINKPLAVFEIAPKLKYETDYVLVWKRTVEALVKVETVQSSAENGAAVYTKQPSDKGECVFETESQINRAANVNEF